MPFDLDQYQRRALRLAGYDYTAGGPFFVTMCTHDRACLFGDIDGDEADVMLSPFGEIVIAEWVRTADIRSEAVLDAFVVMPNHLHAIVALVPDAWAHGRAPLPRTGAGLYRAPRSLGSLIAGFKAATTKRINAERGTPSAPVWQRNYFEHIIRNDRALDRIRDYLAANPACWALDENNPVRFQRTLPPS